VLWDARALPAGAYFIEARTAGEARVVKLVKTD
jgi:hypothetical protein